MKIAMAVLCGAICLFGLHPGHAMQTETPPDEVRDPVKAFEFYYDSKFENAQRVFSRFSEKHESVDILYWIGSSALKSEKYDEAISNLEKSLAGEPDLSQARLELAVAYYRAGRTADARKELETVKSAASGAEAMRSAERWLEKIDRPPEQLTWKYRAALGVQYDDNITCGPAVAEIEDTIRTERVILNENSREKSGINGITDLKADVLFDIGEAGGVIWSGGLDLFNSLSFEDSDFNYLDVDLFTGPWWVKGNDAAKLPLGFTHRRYGGESLSNVFHIGPSYERFLGETFSFKAVYSISVENFNAAKYADAGYDNVEHAISLGPSFYPKSRRHIVSGFLTYEIHDADESRHAYKAPGLTALYFIKFRTRTEILLQYKYVNKQYDGNSFLYDKDREDERHAVNAVIGRSFLDNWFASAEIAYIDNNSNAELYDFDKTAFTVSVGIKF